MECNFSSNGAVICLAGHLNHYKGWVEMKIVSVEVISVYNNFRSANSKWSPIVVKINTDEGISGFGEVSLAYGKGASAGFGMVKDLAPLVLGENP